MTLNDWFDKILCINLDDRTDKWRNCQRLFKEHNMTVERFRAHDLRNGTKDVLRGCTASHRGCLELICHHGWKRTLILEDDFSALHRDLSKRFFDMIGEVPTDWEMLYLGGHYAEPPQYRVSPHVIRIGRMMTTSSYAVTLKFARDIAPWFDGPMPPDVVYFEKHRERKCYIFQPRLMAQGETFSDLQQRVMNNEPCMTDTRHEQMV